jgi:hypothetical protein
MVTERRPGGRRLTLAALAAIALASMGAMQHSAPSPAATGNDGPGDDTFPPAGTISIAGGAAWSKSTSVTISTSAVDYISGVALVSLSNDGTTWTERPYAATQSWTLSAGDGTKTVWAKWRDGAGNWSSAKSDTIGLDTTAPYYSYAISSTIGKAGTALVNGAMPIRFGSVWYEGGSGLVRFHLSKSIDFGEFTSISTKLTSSIVKVNVLPGHQYYFAMRAVDRAGNVSRWEQYVGGANLTAIQQSSSSVVYHGPWTTSTSTTWWGGSAKGSTTSGSTASLTFTGRQVAWIALKAPNRGKAQVYLDGVLRGTVDLYAPTLLKQRVIWRSSWPSGLNDNTHTIRIRVLGTAGRPKVDVDGFFVSP